MAMKLTPKNWSVFQHYKDRRPPWIKLYRNLLDDMKFMRLPIASKAIAPCLWLLASEFDDGVIDMSIEEIAFRLRMTEKEIESGLKALIDNEFFYLDSMMLASSLHGAIPEREKEIEIEKEKNIRFTAFDDFGFNEFWNVYDKKVGKPFAQKEWSKAKIDEKLLKTVLEQAKKYAQATDKKFRKDPERWIKYRGWEDEIIAIEPSKGKELPLGSDKQIEEAYRVECGGDPAKARFNSYFDMKKFILDNREKRARA